MKAIKNDSDSDSDEQKRWSVFEKKEPGMTPQNWRLKNRGVTPSVAAPGVTQPSDATGLHGWGHVPLPSLKISSSSSYMVAEQETPASGKEGKGRKVLRFNVQFKS